uniref:Uncharacterized protein n=1 Tax=Anguilla anguilla TaxID=7936 RepID=A0A0E9W146_ANGAN
MVNVHGCILALTLFPRHLNELLLGFCES